MQVLQPEWDTTFSDFSYGFRPDRSAHDAVLKAQEYLRKGYGWVVDIDLEKFFDRVNHDKLMSLVSMRIEDKRVITLIRRYLTSGVLIGENTMKPTRALLREVPYHHFCKPVA